MPVTIGRRDLVAALGSVAVWPRAWRGRNSRGGCRRSARWAESWQYQSGRSFGGSSGRDCADLGYIEGQNIEFEFRSAEGHLDRLPELAAELVRLNVDIIVYLVHAHRFGSKASDERNPNHHGQTRRIPLVRGWSRALPRPGGNVTGIARRNRWRTGRQEASN